MNYFRKYSIVAYVQLAAIMLLSGCLDQATPNGDSGATGTNGGGNLGNSPPTISGAPGNAIKIGDSYSFTPTVGDPDGDPLSFVVQNLPQWASFDSAKGSLSGTPSLADVATYSSIVISVTDGTASVWLPPFSITVSQTGTGSVTLTWAAPTQNTDGSALVDLASYRIYYGQSEGSYPNEIQIDNPGITMYVVDNLTPSTYFFVSTSINSNGIESDYSNAVSRTAN